MTEEKVSGLVGRRVGVYSIVEEVGKGGMGVVYRARDMSLDRDVALKVLQPGLATDPEFERRFVREARAAAKLDHPNIVQVYSAGRFENVLFMAMQFVKGRTLTQLQAERQGRFEVPEALSLVRQAAEALEAAHKAGLVHRDIKPNNIMIDDAGRVKIMDFGLMRSSFPAERITQTGVFFGTPEYASPEQCESSDVDGRSDIYSLGAVLYEMLTGRVPHVAETPLALFKKISEEDAPDVTEHNPRVPRPVAAIVRRMLARDRADRYPTCGALVADVDRAMRGEAVSESARTLRLGARRPGRRTAAGMAAAGALLLAGLVWLLVTSVGGADRGIGTGGSGRIGLVVFDFRNGTGAAADQWYEIALSDLLISALSQNDLLSVPTREQLLWKVQDMALGDRVKEEHRRRLVGEFGAHAYVAGTYYVKDGRVRITVACYRTRDNAPAFAPLHVERAEPEMFALVDELASALARGLQGAAGGSLAAQRDRGVRSCEELPLAWARGEEQHPRREAGRAAAEPAPAAPGAPKDEEADALLAGNLERKRFAGRADADRLRHWYQSVRLLEKSGCDPEEYELLMLDLRGQFAGGDDAALQRAVESFQKCMGDVAEAKRAWGVRLRREHLVFVCCPGVARPDPGPCPKCGAACGVRLKLPAEESRK